MVLNQKQQMSRLELTCALTFDLMNQLFVLNQTLKNVFDEQLVNDFLHGSENFTFSRNAKIEKSSFLNAE